MIAEEQAAGPAQEAVAVKLKRKARKVKPKVLYVPIKIQNLTDSGDPASFTAQGKAYTILEDVEALVPVTVAENLEALREKRLVMTSDPNNPGRKMRKIQARPRFHVTRLGEPREK